MSIQLPGSDQSVSEYFPTGAVAKCLTCHGEEIQGEVVAFDHIAKILILKSPVLEETSSNQKSRIQLINLGLVRSAEVVKEPSTEPPSLSAIHFDKHGIRDEPHLIFQKITKRAHEEALRKRRSITTAPVPMEAKSLFQFMSKTMEDVSWDQEMIVMKCVTICAPYKPENVQLRKAHTNSDKQAELTLQHVRKIVERHQVESHSSKQSSPTSTPVAPT